MKKNKFCIPALVILAVTLALAVSSGSASVGVLNNGQIENNGLMVAIDKGATIPTDIVVGQTNLQIQSSTDTLGTQGLTAITVKQTIQPATISAGTNSPMTANNAQDASLLGSGAQLVTQSLAGADSFGGNFHTGKMLASFNGITPADLMMTSVIAA